MPADTLDAAAGANGLGASFEPQPSDGGVVAEEPAADGTGPGPAGESQQATRVAEFSNDDDAGGSETGFDGSDHGRGRPASGTLGHAQSGDLTCRHTPVAGAGPAAPQAPPDEGAAEPSADEASESRDPAEDSWEPQLADDFKPVPQCARIRAPSESSSRRSFARRTPRAAYGQAAEPVYGPVPVNLMIAGGLFFTLAVCCVAVSLAALHYNFSREDRYHPGPLALSERHWTSYRGQFDNIPHTVGLDNVQLTQDQRRAGCIDTTISGARVGNLPREEYPCRFEVPYVAVLAAAAVCFACCGASCFEGYSVLCRWLGGDALRSARLLVRGEVVRVYMGQGTVFLCAAAALFAFLFVGLDQHGEGTHNPVYCTCFLVGGVATWLAAEAASLMAAEAAGRLAAWGYEGTPTPEGCFWLESRVARRGALAAALGASAAVLAGFAAVYVGFSDAVGLLAFALGSATAAFCLRLAAATAGAAAEGAQGLLAAGAGAERCGLPFAFQGGVRARSADAASPAAATGGTPPDSRILLSPGSPLRARSPSSRGFHTPYPNPAPGCEDAVVASGRGGELGPLSGRGACYVVRPPAPRPAATAAGGLGPLSGRGECSVVRPPAPGPAANAGDAWEPAGAALRLAGGGAGAAAGLLCSCVTAAAAACLLGAPEFGRDGVGLPFSVAAVGLGSSAVATGFFYRRAGDALPDATRRKAVLASAAVHVAVSAAVVVPYFGGIADTGLSGNQDHPGPRLYGCVALGAVLACAVQLGAEIHTAPALLPQRSARELLDRGLAAGILQGLGIGSVAGACHSILSAGIVIATYYLAGFFGTAVASCSMMSMLVAPMTAAELSSLAESSYSMCVMAGMSPLGDDRAAQMLQLRSYSRTASAAAEAYAEVGLWISSVSLVVAFGRASGCDGVAAFKPVVIFGLLAGLSFPHLLTSLLVWGVFDVSRDINHKVRAGLSYLVTGRFIPVSVLMARSALRAFGPLVVVACVPFLLGFTFGARSLFAFLAGGVTTALLSGLSGGATGSLMPDAGSTKPTRESAFFGTSLRNVAAPSLALATAMAVCLAVLAAPLFGTGAQHFAFGLAVLIMGLFAIVTWEAVMLRRHERNGGSATGISGFD